MYPLEAVDRYLESLGREQLYNTIAEGSHDKDGRWYSFIDYYKYVYKKLDDEKSRIKIGIEEDEVGEIEDICFKIIRKKDFKGLMKTHMVMRKIPSILTNRAAKKELMEINQVPDKLSKKNLIKYNWALPFGSGFSLQSFCPTHKAIQQKGFPLRSLTQNCNFIISKK